MCKPSAVGVRKNIDLNLSDTTGKLISQRRMMVVETPQSLGILDLQVLPLAGRESGVVAIMRTDHLDLIQVDQLVLRSHATLLAIR